MSKRKTAKRVGRKSGTAQRRGTGSSSARRPRSRANKQTAKDAASHAAHRKRERWVSIASFPDYEASNHGHIRRANGAAGTQEGRVLKPRVVRGYLRVDVRKKGASYNKGVANLVAEAFIGKPPTYRNAEGVRKPKLITHVDGDRNNNAVGNLLYRTRSESVRARMPARNSQAKLTPAKVRSLRKDYGKGMSGADMGRKYGISVSAALSAAQGKTWKDVA